MDKRIKYLFLILLISSGIFVSNANAALLPFSDIKIGGKSIGCWTIQVIGFSPFTCSFGNNTLHFTHGAGINITEFPTNHTLWFNATAGSIGPQGPQGNPTSLNFTTNNDFDFRFIPRNMSWVQLAGQIFTFQMKSNVVLTNESAQTVTKQLTLNQLILGGDENVGSNALTNSGHKSTLPSTSGIICQTNQTSHCGTDLFNGTISSINSQTGPAISLVRGSPGNITITNSTNLISINTGQNIANLATTNNQTFSGKVNFTTTSKLAGLNVGTTSTAPTNLKNGDCYYNTATNLYRCEEAGSDRSIVMNNDANTMVNKIFISGPNSVLADATDSTKRFTWLLSGATTGKTLTMRVNQTTTQGLNIPNISATDTLATLGVANTFSNNQTIATGQNIYMGTANITTTAVRGYLYLSVTDGTPTGTPASHTGGVPVLFDGKTNRLCIYNSGWKCVQLS